MSEFTWPGRIRAAVSVSFDDGRVSQLEQAMPILDAHDARGTFYILPRCVESEQAARAWRAAAQAGHEMGNHTVTHPCSGNYGFARARALENLTLEQMAAELDGAQRVIDERLGVTPTSFAYPCGQRFVGRGVGVQSYVPLVAQRFGFGRAFRDESANDPAFCDPAQLFGVDFDGISVEELEPWLDATIAQGHWLVLAGHDVSDEPARQAIPARTLAWLCARAREDEALWLDTVSNVGACVMHRREAAPAEGGV